MWLGESWNKWVRESRKKIPTKAACSHLFQDSRSHLFQDSRSHLLQVSCFCLVKRKSHRRFHRRFNQIKGAVSVKAKPPMTNRDSLLHSCGSPSSGQTKSRTNAGTISKMGNGNGTMCVMFWYTGPSLGCAGNSGRTHIMISTKAVYTSVMMVRAH